ncbi:MAG: STAS domain-containing protein [Planctomycetes bacterium]|nr:STAS domain-containing protein [Planctomycetota bacterium]MBL7106574.1 STAS domain-containing protein [Phycisphaerae bacterium]
MSIQRWSENIVVVDLSKEPQTAEDIQDVIDLFKGNADFDVVMDFEDIDIITSSSISALLKLNKLLSDSGRKLILSSMSKATKNILNVIGVEELFEFINEKFMALAGLQMVH